MLEGKGMFVWQVRSCENGDVAAIASLAASAALSHVLVKIADGNFAYNVDQKTGEDMAMDLTRALKSRGIQVYGWHYIYGYDPATEANRAIQRVEQLELDGYVINAETEYKDSGKDRAANIFMTRLRSGLPDLPIGLSSYRFPSLHRYLPWKEFLLKCDFIMPQVYWLLSSNPGAQLRRSVADFQQFPPFRPIVPTGVAFKFGDWKPTMEQIGEFIDTAAELNLTGFNFWEWARCRKHLPEIWDLVASYPGKRIANQDDIVQQYLALLNRRDSAAISQLYRPDAVHVTDSHTLKGAEQIQNWYQTVFTRMLPGAVFRLSGAEGRGSVRHLNWTAVSRLGKVNDGSDTIGLVKDRIAYHYSSFSVS